MNLGFFDGYRQKFKWQYPVVVDTYSATFCLSEKEQHYLVVCRGNEGDSPKLAELMHAVLLKHFDFCEDYMEEYGVLAGGQNITKILMSHNYSDAYNPLLWRRAMIIKDEKFSPYIPDFFHAIGVIGYLEYLAWQEMTQNGDTQGIYNLLRKLFDGSGDGVQYVDFLGSHWMSATSAGKK